MSRYLENKLNILGVDYGEVNSGFAVAVDGICSPLKNVNSKNLIHFIKEIEDVAVKYQIKEIVFGLPLTHNDLDTKQSIKVRQIVNQIKKFVKIPIYYISEYSTTQEALSTGIMTSMSRKKRNKDNDSLSACFILQNYLEQKSTKV